VIATHICLCTILLYPVNLLWWGDVWPIENMSELRMLLFNGLLVGFYTIVVLFLYFLAGRKILSNAHDMLTNVLSVSALFIILAVT